MGIDSLIDVTKKFAKTTAMIGTLAACSFLTGCDKEKKAPRIPVQTVIEGGSLRMDPQEFFSFSEQFSPYTMAIRKGAGKIIDVGGKPVYQYDDVRDADKKNNRRRIGLELTGNNGRHKRIGFVIKQMDTGVYFPDDGTGGGTDGGGTDGGTNGGGTDGGTNGGGSEGTLQPLVSVAPIPDQSIPEGTGLVLDLAQFIQNEGTSPWSGLALKESPGMLSGTHFHYYDTKDADLVDNEHVIQFEVKDQNGTAVPGSFKVRQLDGTAKETVATMFASGNNWIAYSPTNYNPNTGVQPSEESVRLDIRELLRANFNSIVLYGSDEILAQVPRIAKEEGIKYVVGGVWNPRNAAEVDNAVASKAFIDAYCVGNEGLRFGRYSLDDVLTAMASVRARTDRPVTTTETIDDYTDDLLSRGDWVFSNAHAFWHGKTVPQEAVDWTMGAYESMVGRMVSLGLDKRLVFKEVGLPSTGAVGLSAANQNAFYRLLEDAVAADSALSGISIYVPFEAFDQFWKEPGAEDSWGLFDKDRNPKEAALPQIFLTYVPPAGVYENVQCRSVNVRPQDYRIAAYITVPSLGTWVKPYGGSLSVINSAGKSDIDCITGGWDHLFDEVFVYIVAPSYLPDLHVKPVLTDPLVKAMTSAKR